MARKEDNKALRDLDALVKLVQNPSFYTDIRAVLTRTRFSSGRKVHRPNELGDPKKSGWQNKPDRGSAPQGTTEPSYGDPTGEDAIFAGDEMKDNTALTVSAMQKALSQWLIMTRWILDLANTDPEARAMHSTPNCQACGDPCFGGAKKGLDEKCRYRKKKLDPIDRHEFIWMVRREKQAEALKAAEEAATQEVQAKAE